MNGSRHYWSVDAVAAGGLAATFLDIIPKIAAALAAVYYLMLMYDWISGKVRKHGEHPSALDC